MGVDTKENANFSIKCEKYVKRTLKLIKKNRRLNFSCVFVCGASYNRSIGPN